MENEFDEIKQPNQQGTKFFEQFEGNIEELSYYELTELVHQFYMKKL